MSVNKSVFHLLIASIFCFISISCTKPDQDISDQPGIAVRNKGQAIGAATNISLSPNGGSFSVTNQPIIVDVPAGAAATGTILTVQEISNTSPGSIGPAFRISTNTELNAPVTINYSYRDLLDSIGINPECTLSLSVQDSIGVWWLQTGRTINLAQQVVSIGLRAGDVALVTPVKLTPAFSTLRPRSEIELEAVGTLVIAPQTDICDFFRTGASPVAMTEEYLLDPALADRWILLAEGEGVGTLQPKGSSATYKTADFELPEINPATILFYMKSSPKPLSAKVFVQTDVTGLSIWIGNTQYLFNDAQVELGMDNDGSMGMSWEGSDGMGSMTWKQNANGTYSWNENNTMFLFEPTGISPQQAFQSFFNDGRTVRSGDIIITKAGSVGQKISGTLLIQEAGRTNTESGNGEYLGSSKLVGTFNLMRDF